MPAVVAAEVKVVLCGNRVTQLAIFTIIIECGRGIISFGTLMNVQYSISGIGFVIIKLSGCPGLLFN